MVVTLATVALAQDAAWIAEWPDTEVSKTSIAFSEVTPGGPPKDGIPAIDDPRFIQVVEESRLEDREPVVAVEIAGEPPRAYPVRYTRVQ
jgi:hypothetical protein